MEEIDKLIEKIESEQIMIYRYDEVIEMIENLKAKLTNDN